MPREWLKKWRASNGYTMTEAAEVLGIDRTYYYRLEEGKRTPSVDKAKELAKIIKVKRWQSFFVKKEVSVEGHQG